MTQPPTPPGSPASAYFIIGPDLRVEAVGRVPITYPSLEAAEEHCGPQCSVAIATPHLEHFTRKLAEARRALAELVQMADPATNMSDIPLIEALSLARATLAAIDGEA